MPAVVCFDQDVFAAVREIGIGAMESAFESERAGSVARVEGICLWTRPRIGQVENVHELSVATKEYRFSR